MRLFGRRVIGQLFVYEWNTPVADRADARLSASAVGVLAPFDGRSPVPTQLPSGTAMFPA